MLLLLCRLVAGSSLSARRAWIEIIDDLEPSKTRRSLSARRAWIEMPVKFDMLLLMYVALRKESVDRNVDTVQIVIVKMVALRKESVDRNSQRRDFKALGLLSLSARRAWIEIASGTLSDTSDVSRSPQGERG